jgi:extradiol dioxygenase family protein
MSVAAFGNHSSVMVPRQDRDSIRKFYCDVIGGKIVKSDCHANEMLWLFGNKILPF